MVQSDKTSKGLSMHSPVASKYQKQCFHILCYPFTRIWAGWFKEYYISNFIKDYYKTHQTLHFQIHLFSVACKLFSIYSEHILSMWVCILIFSKGQGFKNLHLLWVVNQDLKSLKIWCFIFFSRHYTLIMHTFFAFPLSTGALQNKF